MATTPLHGPASSASGGAASSNQHANATTTKAYPEWVNKKVEDQLTAWKLDAIGLKRLFTLHAFLDGADQTLATAEDHVRDMISLGITLDPSIPAHIHAQQLDARVQTAKDLKAAQADSTPGPRGTKRGRSEDDEDWDTKGKYPDYINTLYSQTRVPPNMVLAIYEHTRIITIAQIAMAMAVLTTSNAMAYSDGMPSDNFGPIGSSSTHIMLASQRQKTKIPTKKDIILKCLRAICDIRAARNPALIPSNNEYLDWADFMLSFCMSGAGFNYVDTEWRTRIFALGRDHPFAPFTPLFLSFLPAFTTAFAIHVVRCACCFEIGNHGGAPCPVAVLASDDSRHSHHNKRPTNAAQPHTPPKPAKQTGGKSTGSGTSAHTDVTDPASNTVICNKFQWDKCTTPNCPRAHKCKKCFNPNHTEKTCTN